MTDNDADLAAPTKRRSTRQRPARQRMFDVFAERAAPLSLAEMKLASVPHRVLADAETDGLVEMLAPGVYAPAGYVPDVLRPYAEVALRFRSAAFFGRTAAWLHGLVFAEPEEIEILQPRSTGRPSTSRPPSETRNGNRPIRFVALCEEKADFGIGTFRLGNAPYGPVVSMATPGRTVADLCDQRRYRVPGYFDEAFSSLARAGGDVSKIIEAVVTLDAGIEARRVLGLAITRFATERKPVPQPAGEA